MFIAIAFVAALVFAYALSSLYKHERSKRGSTKLGRELASLDPWVHQELVRIFSRSLKNASADKLRASFKGDPDVECVAQIERSVDRVELEFVKYAHETAAEISLHVLFEDGTREKSVTHRALPELPETVRKEFEERAVTRLFRAWEFPWA
jgi:hypothetical protein